MVTHCSKGQALIEAIFSFTLLLLIWLAANQSLSTYQSSQKKMEKHYGSETKVKRVRTK